MLRIGVTRVAGAVPEPGSAPEWMSDSERLRWPRLSPTGRSAFAASRSLLRRMLQDATGRPASDWHVSADAGSAPAARATEGSEGGRCLSPLVSLSHRRGWVAAAVSEGAVGIDIECERPALSDAAERAALMLAPSELMLWRDLPDCNRESALLTAWTAKEAWFKASPPDAVPWDFRLIVARACPPEHANVRVWASPPLHVAVCADGRALLDACCGGLPDASTSSSFWHVARAMTA